jgi:hypothetical protein
VIFTADKKIMFLYMCVLHKVVNMYVLCKYGKRNEDELCLIWDKGNVLCNVSSE